MYWDVVDVKPIGHLVLQVRFSDGLEGRVRIDASFLHGVFAPLKDPAFFNRVSCTDGFVTWPGELDLAPDAMHEGIKASGELVISGGIDEAA